MNRRVLLIAILSLAVGLVFAQDPPPVNYDESKVEPYSLEDPLVYCNGRKVRKKADWPERRVEILDIFQREMYGQLPPRPEASMASQPSRMSWKVVSKSPVYQGSATSRPDPA